MKKTQYSEKKGLKRKLNILPEEASDLFLKKQCMTELHISFELLRIKGFFMKGIYFDASRIRIPILKKIRHSP